MQTDHFEIHFAEPLRPLAEKIAPLAERVHDRVSLALDWVPKGKTHLVLADQSDNSGPFTTVFPQRQIQFDISLPPPEKGLNDYGDWHEFILTHEYAHVLHLDRNEGAYSWLSSAFGSVMRPNLTVPAWLKEGLGVYLETRLTSRGRGSGSTYPMMMRMAVADGLLRDPKFATKDTIALFDDTDWPWTIRPYLMGYYLVRTLVEESDPSYLKRLTANTASALPYDLGAVLKGSAFRSFDELWNRTLERIETEARRELEKIRQKPRTPLTYLTDTGHLYHGLTLSPDGKRLVTSRDHPGVENAILEIRLDGDGFAQARKLVDRFSGHQSAFSKSSRFLVFDQSMRAKRHYVLSDIHIYDLKKKEIVSVSPYARARDPDVHPDGKHVIFVMNDKGKNLLVQTDTSWQNAEIFLETNDYRRISGPRFSPGGEQVALSLHNSRGGEDLWVIDSGGARELIADGSQNTSPQWTPDGRYILFSSDRSGVANIYALEVKTGALHQLTHVEGGVFHPVLDPASRWVYVVSFRGKGYDVARFRWDPATWSPVPPPYSPDNSSTADPFTPVVHEVGSRAKHERALTTTEYESAPFLLPQYLKPSLSFGRYSVQFGLETGAVDPLFFRHYTFALRYDTATHLPAGRLFFFDGSGSAAWDLNVEHQVTPFFSRERGFSTLNADASLNIPLSRDGSHVHLRPGLLFQAPHSFGTVPFGGSHLGLRYDTRFKEIGRSFHESGKLVDLELRQLTPLDGSALGSASLILNLEAHSALGDRGHGLHLSLRGAALLGGDVSTPASTFVVTGRDMFPFTDTGSYTLYGFDQDRFVEGTGVGVAEVFYSFPILDIQRGGSHVPISFGRLSGGFRTQLATIEDRGAFLFPWSTGAELHQDLVAGHLFGLSARLGVYYTPPSLGGGWQGLFTLVGSDF